MDTKKDEAKKDTKPTVHDEPKAVVHDEPKPKRLTPGTLAPSKPVAVAPHVEPPPPEPKVLSADASAAAMDAKRVEIETSEKHTKKLHAELDAMIGAHRHAK